MLTTEGQAAGSDPAQRAWLGSKTPIAPATSMDPGPKFLAYAGLVTGAWAGLLSLLVFGIASLAGVSFVIDTGGVWSAVRWFAVLLVPLGAAEVGAMASLLVRGRKHARAIVFWAGTLIAAASCAIPFMQEQYLSAAIVLAVMHVITWLLVVPQIARIIGDTQPDARVNRAVL